MLELLIKIDPEFDELLLVWLGLLLLVLLELLVPGLVALEVFVL